MAEIGVDMSVFSDARHLASWAGLCPGNRESGGKRMSGRTRKANRYVKRAMCQAAWAASHTKDTYLSAFYRRMSVRKGAPKAVMALAHHMMVVIYQVLRAVKNTWSRRRLLRSAEQAEGGSPFGGADYESSAMRWISKPPPLTSLLTLCPSTPLVW